jgi:SAM-dependent methyltransferase
VTGGHDRRVQAQFAASAALYVASPDHAAGQDLDRLLAWGRALRPGLVLDVATGGGHTALAFAGLAPRVVAVDLTEAMLHAARAFIRGRGVGHVVFVAGNVERLPFADAVFPVVTCRIAPHHFADVAAAVREVARVLAPGGSFLLQDILGHDDPAAAAFITEVERRRDPSHARAYRASEWRAFLRGAGLSVVQEAVVSKVRRWDEWTGRMRLSAEARRALEEFVRRADPAHHAAFDFRFGPGGIASFTDRMILIRADRD